MLKKGQSFLKSKAFRELFSYAVVGGLTTVVNIGAFYLLTRVLFRLEAGWRLDAANIAANVFSIAFAFFANKKYVFASTSWDRRNVLCEAGQFAMARLAALVLDVFLVHAGVNWLNWPEMPVKVAVNLVVIAANYVTGKWWVFKKK